MRRGIIKIALWLCCLLAGARTDAKENVNMPAKNNSHISNKTEAGDCVASTSEFDIDINNVRARLLGGGDMWWDFTNPRYEVPKGNGGNPLCSIFAGAIWISGLDAGGNLKLAAQTYRQGGNDYWPGPVIGGQVDQSTCAQYDKHFSVLGANISIAQTVFSQKGAQTSESDIPKDVLSWPAIGNPYLATDPTLVGQTYSITSPLAPFNDVNGDGIYDPVTGDYPVIPCSTPNCTSTAFGDQMVFWVFNDVGNIHTQTNGQQIGVQVNALAFAFQSTDAINNMTFYKYQIINQSSNKLLQTYISQWVDPDLGCFSNDRVGCDTTRKLGFCYNGTTPDPNCQIEFGYNTDLPEVGVSFFEGPLNDSNVQIGLSSFVYFTNGDVAAKTDPSTAPQYRNYQTGFWADGTPFTQGGTGYGGTTPTHFIFPGDPGNANDWSECTVSLAAGDRRFVESSGPFTLRSGISEFVTVGVPWVQPSTAGGVGLCPAVNSSIGPAADKAQALFNTNFQLLNGPDAPTLQIRELNSELIINLVNLPGSNNQGESYAQVDGTTAQSVRQYLNGRGDSLYRFQGYLLYQVASATVSPNNLSDNTQAQLIAEVDVQDNITQIINFVFDPALALYVPTFEPVGITGGKLGNTGIVSSFDIKSDLFATGSVNQLLNHQTYYFTAIAFAYNNYLQYSTSNAYNPANPTNPSTAGQLLPYLQGRNNFQIYQAVPHIIDSRDNGTVLNSNWGQGVEVNRIEGQGNGGNGLLLTPETITKILSSSDYFGDTLTYMAGADPLGLQVTDPVALKEADFELQFVNDTGPIGDSTRWLLHDLTNNDTIFSDRTLDRPYQQEIMVNTSLGLIDYGFSITLGTPFPQYTINATYLTPTASTNRYVFAPITNKSQLTYQDSTKPWLVFVPNGANSTVNNWIRSGTLMAAATLGSTNGGNSTPNPLAGVWDDNWYYLGSGGPGSSTVPMFDDSNSIFTNILNGTWGPYCLSPNYSNKNAASGSPPFVYGPGFKWVYYGNIQAPPQNTLDQLASVDVVITPDKSLWSHCVVFETGEDESLNQGAVVFPRSHNNTTLYNENAGALKGQIRMQYSMDWNNPATHDFLITNQADTGRSWFPGYAINVETGARLNIAFGENSSSPDQNGADMLWDPTGNLYYPISFPGNPIPSIPYFGGKHFIYVMQSKYDEGVAAQQLLLSLYDSIRSPEGGIVPTKLAPLYRSLMWTSIPYLNQGYSFNSDNSGNPAYIPPSTVTIQLRVAKPYNRLATIASINDDSLPRYQFSTKGLGAVQNQIQAAKSALDEVRVVPNPYLAYSNIETGPNSNLVQITNLPNVCTVSIYSLDGTLINVLNRSVGVDPTTNQQVETTSGGPVTGTQVENSITWALTNTANIPVASGIYLFHIEAPGIGQKTIKWFGVLRPADTSNF